MSCERFETLSEEEKKQMYTKFNKADHAISAVQASVCLSCLLIVFVFKR